MTETSAAPEVVMPELVINAFAPEPALIAELESKSAITSPKTRWRISIHSLTVVDGWVSAERSPATPSSVLCFLALKRGSLDPCRSTNANVCSSHCHFTICGILQSGLTLLKTPGLPLAAARPGTRQFRRWTNPQPPSARPSEGCEPGCEESVGIERCTGSPQRRVRQPLRLLSGSRPPVSASTARSSHLL